MSPTNGLKGKLALAYAAGIIDGEGTICLIKTRRSNRKRPYAVYLQVGVGMTSEWVTCWFKMQFGGGIQYYQSKTPSRRPVFRWYLDRSRAVDFLQMILPYLQIKKPQAELAIRFQSRKRMGPHSDEIAAIEEAERILMKKYNTGNGTKQCL